MSENPSPARVTIIILNQRIFKRERHKTQYKMPKYSQFVYAMPPIDFWDGWIPYEIAFENPTKFGIKDYYESSELDIDECIDKGRQFITESLEKVESLLNQYTNWEGDGHVYLSTIPFPEASQSEVVFAIKQANDGTTFVVSPAEYIHLKEYLIKAL